MKTGRIIKHERAMDVCFLITKVRGPYYPSDMIELTGGWINMGFVESFRLGIRQKIRVDKAALVQWRICSDPTTVCLRHVEWL